MNKYNVDYIPNRELHEAMVKCIESGFTDKKSYNKVGVGFLQISNKLVESSSWGVNSKQVKEKMVGDAVEALITKFLDGKYKYKKFDNPFAWATSVIFNKFRQAYNKNEKDKERNTSLDEIQETSEIVPSGEAFKELIDSSRVRTSNKRDM